MYRYHVMSAYSCIQLWQCFADIEDSSDDDDGMDNSKNTSSGTTTAAVAQPGQGEGGVARRRQM